MDPPSKKVKKRNFSDKETEVLLEEVGFQYTVLVSQLQNSVTIKKKREVWQRIADRVNAVGGCNRDWEACKKRWKDLKAAYLKKPKVDAGTGGGKPAPPVPYEDVICQIVGDSNLSVGIEGGGDTFTTIIVSEENTTKDSTLASSEIQLTFEDIPTRASSPILHSSVPARFTLFPNQEDIQVAQSEISIMQPLCNSSASTCIDCETGISSHIRSTSPANEETPRVISSNISSRPTSENVETPRVISCQMKRKMQKRRMESTSKRNPVVPAEEQDSEAELTKQFMSSEIEKNKVKIELYKIKIERNKNGKEVDEMMKHKLQLEIERLKNECEKDN